MPKKGVAVTVCYYAYDTSGAKTGDVSNHTLRVVADGTVGTISASPAEVDATNFPGLYKVVVASGENTGAMMCLGGKSATSGVTIVPTAWTNEVNVAQVSDDATAADNLQLMFDGTGYAGGTTKLKVDVETIKTQAVTCAAGVTVLASVGTAATMTAQTGDAYAIVNSGTHGNAALKTLIDAVDDYIDTEVTAIKTKTDYLPSITAGSAGGLFIAGANAATTVNITGNITGNVTGSVGSVTGAVGSVTGNVGGNVTGSVGSVTGAVGSVTGNVGGNVTGSVGSIASGGITAASIATGAIDADALTADAVDAILDEAVEGSITLRQAIRGFLAVLAGKSAGGGSVTITFRDQADTKDRITATVDTDGNRSAVVLDLS